MWWYLVKLVTCVPETQSSTLIHKVCPEGVQPCTVKNRDIYWRRYKKHCTQDNDASVPFKGGTLRPHTVLPITISYPVIFSESHQWSKISSLSKVILVFRKARNHRVPDLCCSGAESPGWFDVSQANSARDVWYLSRHVVMMKLPVTSCPELWPSESSEYSSRRNVQA